MLFQVHASRGFDDIPPPHASILRECLIASTFASNRMLPGIGRPRAAGRPDLIGRLAA